MEKLCQFGWNTYTNTLSQKLNFQRETTGRVLSVKGNNYELASLKGIVKAELLGRLLFAYEKWEQPKVGDWVTFIDHGDMVFISDVLPRKNELYRKTAGKVVEKQVMVTNVDKAVVIQGLDNDFNLKRIERYLVQVASCGIEAVIILNKSDLVKDAAAYEKQIDRLQREVPYFFCSVKTGNGISNLKKEIFKPGTTSVLIGSSGVGKSSLINEFMHSGRKTGEISDATGKGKHTTTTRDMFLLDNGAIVVDTPGMREFGVGENDPAEFDKQFPAIAKFAENCRYNNCKHINEKGCNVIEAHEEGLLDSIVYESYLKLQKELEHFRMSSHEKKKQGKHFGKMVREAKEYRERYKY